jgi:hypothetical protein
VTEQIAMQMADLGLTTRDKVYAPDAEASGRDLLYVSKLMFYRRPCFVVR